MVGDVSPGWYPEPTGRPGVERYFDGASWTDETRAVTLSFPDPTLATATDPVRPTGAFNPVPARTKRRGRPVVAVPGAAVAPQESWESPFAATVADEPTTGGSALFVPTPGAAVPPGWEPSVRPGTTQALQLVTAKHFVLPDRPSHADPGWFPDPARGQKIRFYDGDGWTARVRAPLNGKQKKLPVAAVAFRARMIALADDRAAKSDAGRRWRAPVTVVRAVRHAPSLHVAVRTRAGRVGGMMSMTAFGVAITMAVFLGWQHWLSAGVHQIAQAEMRDEVVADLGGEVTDYGTDPTPVALPATAEDNADNDTRAPNPAPTTRPGTSISPEPDTGREPATGPTGPGAEPSRTRNPGAGRAGERGPRNIAPWPPFGWEAPKTRKARSVKEFRRGAPVGRIVIPRMGLDEIMVAGTGTAELAKGVGIATWGVLPGTPGNAVLAGHRTGHGGPFEEVDRLVYGDQIIVEIPKQGRAVFEVRGHKVVRPTDTGVSRQTRGVRLTLTSCHPPGSTGYRYVVQAELVAGDWLDYSINRGDWGFAS